MTLGAGSGESPWKLWTCDPEYRVLEAGSPWRLWTCDTRYTIWEMGSP